MYTLNKYKKNIAELINKILKEELVFVDDFVYPPNAEMGDLSLPCFGLAKKMKKSPVDAAGIIMSDFSNCSVVVGIKIAGPYLNFTLNKIIIAHDILNEIEKGKANYGKNESGQNEKVMIEFSNVNTHKEFHVGHLRNICYGDAVAKLLNVNGNKAIPVSYINDFGIHVAKTLWMLKYHRNSHKITGNKGRFLGQTYSMSTKKAKKDPTSSQMIEAMMKSIETRTGEEFELWKETRQWSIEQFENIYKELEVKFDDTFYESDYIEKGLDMVADLYKKEILIRSEGAIIADLQEYNLNVLMFLRSNGTALYPVADLALAGAKFNKYNLDKSIYVTDNRQGLHFKQLFKVLEQTGHKEEFVHLEYDMVTLPSGTMSSRSGNVITYEDLRDQLVTKIKTETKKRHDDWSEEKIDKTALTIAIGVIKFEMLKVGANQIITFDIEKALEFSGYTATYLQYSVARINSILRKADVDFDDNINFDKLTEDKEKEVILKLAKYPSIVTKAGTKYDPSVITKYLFELGQTFNDYYHSFQILKSEKEIKIARLYLLSQTKQILKNGLELLGIDILDEM